MAGASKLKFISRVGIGLDSVDLLSARRRGIRVSYTPDAPAPAVADLTVGLMICLLRSIHTANDRMHAGQWNRFFGRRITEVNIGIIGVGRIGTRVIRRLASFGPPHIFTNDLSPKHEFNDEYKVEWTDKEQIYREADVISLHLPLTVHTKNMIGRRELRMMKPDALIINTSRGGIIDEGDLYEVVKSGHLGGAAMDVFEKEPYSGPLAELDRCLLTSHMGSMSLDCRIRMEVEATEEAIRFIKGQPLRGSVPQTEFDAQNEGL